MCEHLNSLGVLLWVNNPKTRDFVVLNPQLAIDAVSNVIGLYSHVETAEINAITDREKYLTSGRLLLFVFDFVLFELLWPHNPKNKKAMNEHDSVFCLLTLKQDLPQKHSFMSCFRQLVWKKSFTNSSVNYFSALTFFVKWHLTKQMSVNLFFLSFSLFFSLSLSLFDCFFFLTKIHNQTIKFRVKRFNTLFQVCYLLKKVRLMILLVTKLTEPKFDCLIAPMNHFYHEDCFTVLFASQSGGANSLQNRKTLAVK